MSSINVNLGGGCGVVFISIQFNLTKQQDSLGYP